MSGRRAVTITRLTSDISPRGATKGAKPRWAPTHQTPNPAITGTDLRLPRATRQATNTSTTAGTTARVGFHGMRSEPDGVLADITTTPAKAANPNQGARIRAVIHNNTASQVPFHHSVVASPAEDRWANIR